MLRCFFAVLRRRRSPWYNTLNDPGRIPIVISCVAANIIGYLCTGKGGVHMEHWDRLRGDQGFYWDDGLFRPSTDTFLLKHKQ